MTFLEILALSNDSLLNTYNSNGIHVFYSYSYKGKIIKYYDYLLLIKQGLKPTTIPHLGCKYQITENTWILTLFTSQPSINFYDMIVNNIKLNNNIHLYVNQAFIIQNSTFSEYFTITNNLSYAPKYLQHHSVEKIVIDSIKAYKLSVINSNFNNPLVIIDSLYDHLLNIQIDSKTTIQKTNLNPHIKISRKLEYLKMWGITNSDIYNFTINFQNDKSINKESYYTSKLYFNIHEVPKYRVF